MILYSKRFSVKQIDAHILLLFDIIKWNPEISRNLLRKKRIHQFPFNEET